MRQKQLQSVLIIGMLALFYACQKDDTGPELQIPVLHDDPTLLHRTIRTETINKNTVLKNHLNSIAPKKNLGLNREVYNPELDFTVDTDVANYFEYGAYHSYTFPVHRESDNGLIENLLLSLQLDGSYLAYLVSYDLTEEEVAQMQNDGQIDLKGKVNYNSVNDQG